MVAALWALVAAGVVVSLQTPGCAPRNLPTPGALTATGFPQLPAWQFGPAAPAPAAPATAVPAAPPAPVAPAQPVLIATAPATPPIAVPAAPQVSLAASAPVAATPAAAPPPSAPAASAPGPAPAAPREPGEPAAGSGDKAPSATPEAAPTPANPLVGRWKGADHFECYNSDGTGHIITDDAKAVPEPIRWTIQGTQITIQRFRRSGDPTDARWYPRDKVEFAYSISADGQKAIFKPAKPAEGEPAAEIAFERVGDADR
jgi:hypothetical protein